MGKPKPISISRALDYFVHPDLQSNPDSLHRVRLLVAIIPLFSLVLLTAIVILIVTDVPLFSLLVGGGICTVAFFGLIWLLFRLRRTGNYRSYSAAATAIAFSAIVLGVIVSGGASVSPVTQVMVVPPLMAYFFGGVRWGNYALLASLFTILTFLTLEISGVRFPQTIASASELKIIQFLVIFVAVTAVSGLGLIYEITSAMLKRERDAEHAKVNSLAETDPLTGLANRRKFEAVLTERISAFEKSVASCSFSLCCIDLDGFKPINDRYGHDVGDEVLQAVSSRLRNILRHSDVVGRQGGDEFMLIVDAVSDSAGLKDMAQRLIELIARPIYSSAGPLHVTASLGFAMFPRDGSDIEMLKRAADAAMYEAKRGRTGWSQYRAAEQQNPVQSDICPVPGLPPATSIH